MFRIPQLVFYVKDIALIVSFIMYFIYRIKQTSRQIRVVPKAMTIVLLILMLVCIFSGIIAEIRILNIAIAIRKMFRGFIYMYLCIEYISFEDVENIVHKTYWIQAINLLLVAYQRLILNLSQDLSNGIFGTGLTNNYSSILCLILVCFVTAEYMYGNIRLRTFFAQLIINFGIATLAELKVLFFLIPISILLIMWDKIFIPKGMKILSLMGGAIAVALGVFGVMYAGQLKVLTSVSGLINYNDWGLATHAIVNRKNWFPYTLKNIFGDNLLQNFFGVGFGTVSGNIYGSGIKTVYTSLGYGSYCISTIFLETGFSGLILICVWFIIVLKICLKKGRNKYEKVGNKFGISFVISLIVFLVYANYIFNDSSFLAFFGVAIIFIARKELYKLDGVVHNEQ